MDPKDADLSLGYYRGPLDAVLVGLDGAALDGAVLELDGDPSDELYGFVLARTQADDELREKNRRARRGVFRLGRVVFGTGPLLLPIAGDNLRQLRALSERHADPEIAIALRVFDAEGAIVEAPDVGDNEIWISRRVGPASVEALRRALQDGLRPA